MMIKLSSELMKVLIIIISINIIIIINNIIIIVFSIIPLPKQNKVDPRRVKKASFIQYGCRNVDLVHNCFPKH